MAVSRLDVQFQNLGTDEAVLQAQIEVELSPEDQLIGDSPDQALQNFQDIFFHFNSVLDVTLDTKDPHHETLKLAELKGVLAALELKFLQLEELERS